MKNKILWTFSMTLLFQLLSLSLWGAEGDTYSFTWLDPDKEVYVLQNRKYRKNGRLHLNVGAGLTTSGAFVDSKLLQGRVGYFFREDWGFEAVYSVNDGKENATASSIRNDGGSGSVPFRRIVDNYLGGMVLFSPFYSKINTFNSVIYVDWIVGLGLAKLEETNNFNEFTNTLPFDSKKTQTHTGLMWDAAMKVYLSQNFELRFDLTVIHYKTEKPVRGAPNNLGESTYYSNWDLAVSLGYTF